MQLGEHSGRGDKVLGLLRLRAKPDSLVFRSERYARMITNYYTPRQPIAPAARPDGNCLDADGAAWTQMFTGNACVRVREGGQVRETIELDRNPFACMLGGPDGRTLFILAAEWPGIEKAARTASAVARLHW